MINYDGSVGSVRALLGLITLAVVVAPWDRGSAAETGASAEANRTAIAIEALSRLKGVDLEANPSLKTVVSNVLAQIHEKPEFVELVRQFHIKDQDQALVAYATGHPTTTAGIDAVKLIVEHG